MPTPGTFFAEKSGSLGELGGSGDNRPIWFTPKKDEFGKSIFEESPPKNLKLSQKCVGDTPAGRRRVRPPLYQTPASHKPLDPIYSSSCSAKVDASTSPIQLSTIIELDASENIDAAISKHEPLGSKGNNLKYPQSESKNNMGQSILSVFSRSNYGDFQKNHNSTNEMNGNNSTCDRDIKQRADRQSWFEEIMKVSISSVDKPNRESGVKNSSCNEIVVKLPPKKSFTSNRRVQDHSASSISEYSIKFRSRKQGVLKLKLINVNNVTTSWKLVAIGAAAITNQNNKNRNIITNDKIFRFDNEVGKIDPFNYSILKISFQPLLFGVYEQEFQLRVNGCGVVLLKLEGVHSNRHRREINFNSKLNKPFEICSQNEMNVDNNSGHINERNQQYDKSVYNQSKMKFREKKEIFENNDGMLEHIDRRDLLNRMILRHRKFNKKLETNRKDNAEKNKPQWITSLFDRPPTPGVPIQRDYEQEKNDSIIHEDSISITNGKYPEKLKSLNFGNVELNNSEILHFKLCNPSSKRVAINFYINSPYFTIPTS